MKQPMRCKNEVMHPGENVYTFCANSGRNCILRGDWPWEREPPGNCEDYEPEGKA